MARHVRPKFNPESVFLAAKQFLFNGVVFAKGVAFSPPFVTDRQLMQLYNARYIRIK